MKLHYCLQVFLSVIFSGRDYSNHAPPTNIEASMLSRKALLPSGAERYFHMVELKSEIEISEWIHFAAKTSAPNLGSIAFKFCLENNKNIFVVLMSTNKVPESYADIRMVMATWKNNMIIENRGIFRTTVIYYSGI